jgi:predicted nucleotidyltransferase
MTELALLAKAVGTSERTLRRAVNEGTLRGKRPSPRRLKLSAAEKEYVLRRWGLLAQLRLALRTEPNVRFALLFGSAARGDDHSESDIDLLVEMRDPSFARLPDLELKLERILSRDVQTLTLAEARQDPLLFATALDEGRVIVDRDDRWPSLPGRDGRTKRRAEQQSRQRALRALAGIDELMSRR